MILLIPKKKKTFYTISNVVILLISVIVRIQQPVNIFIVRIDIDSLKDKDRKSLVFE